MNPNNKYTIMQQSVNDHGATLWNINNREPVVGPFDQHNVWADYDEFLFKNIDTANKIALDFGCGPGRNIVKFANRFSNIDGVDISDINLKNAKLWLQANNVPTTNKLIKNNGVDISDVESNTYDIVFSTIAMQHICVYDIRFNLLKEFFRVLKSGGHVCLQMGFGEGHKSAKNYYDNTHYLEYYDTKIVNPTEPKLDLEKIGFINFDYDIRPVGPGDIHDNWIFFRALKP